MAGAGKSYANDQTGSNVISGNKNPASLPRGFDERSGAQSNVGRPHHGFGTGMGYDPARDNPAPARPEFTTLFELPAGAYRDPSKQPLVTMEPFNFRHLDVDTNTRKYFFPTDLPLRPAQLNTTGREILLKVNQFRVTEWPQNTIYQYDVHIGTGAEKRGFIMAVWHSTKLQQKLQELDKMWLFDGNKLAWCAARPPKGELRILIDMDKEKGRAPRVDKKTGQVKSNEVMVRIRGVSEIKMAVIDGYLQKKMPFDNSILEAINFLDHCMRQYPGQLYVQFKRSFFSRETTQKKILALPHKGQGTVEAMKGVYSSMRLCQPNPGSTGLAVNVDVANGTFWMPQNLAFVARNYISRGKPNFNWDTLRTKLSPKQWNGTWTMSDDFKMLRRLVKVRFSVQHRGKESGAKTYTIKGLCFDPKYGATGANAKNVKFPMRDKNNPNAEPTEISVYDYFVKQYNIRLQHWHLPLVKTEKDGTFPMEVCNVLSHQVYKYKLDSEETAEMIKFAVTRPEDRMKSVKSGIAMLKWNEDPYLKHYGIKIDQEMTITKARLLANPQIQMGEFSKKIDPKTAGRWDLRGQRFYKANPDKLVSWGVCIVEGCVEVDVVKNFMRKFIQVYVDHGGKVENRTPVIWSSGANEAAPAFSTTIKDMIQAQANGVEPQIILFVLKDRDAILYNRLKKNMECRFGFVSQMMQAVHVRRSQPQYCSNVCMKLNAKLGGTTSRCAGKTEKGAPGNPIPFFKTYGRTMILGADVSHPSPGSPQPSMAALTMSTDADCCRYAAGVQTNGHRVEMITTYNIRTLWMPLYNWWMNNVGGGKHPEHIYYFRDGVSEGQYMHVLEQEVKDMKKCLVVKYGEAILENVKFTVIVASKRHHLRFFPKDGDRNGNPLPGTLVERDITHPFEYDFYLCSHSAIQGTARPTHYHVILDEMGIPTNILQNMIYQHCYQYMRSTTPVSLFPAVYYAHLASQRARAHEAVRGDNAPRGGQKFMENRQDAIIAANMQGLDITGSAKQSIDHYTEVLPLVELGQTAQGAAKGRIMTSMWYI